MSEKLEKLTFESGVQHGVAMCLECLTDLVNPYNAQTIERFNAAINRRLEEFYNSESEGRIA